MQANKPESFKNKARNRFLQSVIQIKHSLGRKCSLPSPDSSEQGNERRRRLDLPAVIWLWQVFPYLDRKSRDALAEAHSDIAKARRSISYKKILSWPKGKISKFKRPVKSVAFAPDDSTTMLVAAFSKKVFLYDKLQGPQAGVLKGHSGMVASVAFSSDGQTLATASRNDGTLRLWSKSNNDPLFHCFQILQIYQHDLRHIVWSPCSNYIASWGMDGVVRVSDVADGTLRSRHWKNKLEVLGCHETVAFDPISTTTTTTGSSSSSRSTPQIAFAHNNERIFIWNCDTDRLQLLPESVEDVHSYDGNYITSLAYSPEIQKEYYLVAGCHVATLKFWKLTKRIPSDDTEQENGEHSASSDSHAASLGNYSMTDQYDYVFHKQLHLGAGWSAVTLLTFTKDGRYMACSNHGTQIRIIDHDSERVVATLQGHSARIESLCFTSDGATLASASCDRSIRLWNMHECINDNDTPQQSH